MAVIIAAIALVVVLGVLTLYAQRRAHPAPSQAKGDCDTPPAPAPPPPAPKASGGEGTAKQASPPGFLTFAACGDGAKAPAKPTSR